jgi:hypothetical protein
MPLKMLDGIEKLRRKASDKGIRVPDILFGQGGPVSEDQLAALAAALRKGSDILLLLRAEVHADDYFFHVKGLLFSFEYSSFQVNYTIPDVRCKQSTRGIPRVQLYYL